MATPSKKRGTKPLYRDRRYERLRALECFDTVRQFILDGWNPSDVARYIQEEEGECRDISRDTLQNLVTSYRGSIPPAELAERRIPKVMQAAREKVREGICELDELIWLFRVQKERIGIDLTIERSLKKLMPSMAVEVRVAKELLESIANLKMDLGLNERHLGTLGVDSQIPQMVQQAGGTVDAATVLQNPEKRQKLLRIANSFARLTERAEHDQDAVTVIEAVLSAEPTASPDTPTTTPTPAAEIVAA